MTNFSQFFWLTTVTVIFVSSPVLFIISDVECKPNILTLRLQLFSASYSLTRKC